MVSQSQMNILQCFVENSLCGSLEAKRILAHVLNVSNLLQQEAIFETSFLQGSELESLDSVLGDIGEMIRDRDGTLHLNQLLKLAGSSMQFQVGANGNILRVTLGFPGSSVASGHIFGGHGSLRGEIPLDTDPIGPP
jgi:hypothetical protein